jgi:hypothetical protein
MPKKAWYAESDKQGSIRVEELAARVTGFIVHQITVNSEGRIVQNSQITKRGSFSNPGVNVSISADAEKVFYTDETDQERSATLVLGDNKDAPRFKAVVRQPDGSLGYGTNLDGHYYEVVDEAGVPLDLSPEIRTKILTQVLRVQENQVSALAAEVGKNVADCIAYTELEDGGAMAAEPAPTPPPAPQPPRKSFLGGLRNMYQRLIRFLKGGSGQQSA